MTSPKTSIAQRARDAFRIAGTAGLTTTELLPHMRRHLEQHKSVRAYRTVRKGERRRHATQRKQDPAYEDQLYAGLRRRMQIVIWTLLRSGSIVRCGSRKGYALYRACQPKK